METYDAIVIGAGPTGAALALRLARQGRTCLVVDGATFPRTKVCGEGLMPAGAAVLEELGLRAQVGELGASFHGIRYRLPDGTTADGDFPHGLRGLGLDRRRLDTLLVHTAQAHPNLDVRLGTWARGITPATPDDPHVELRLGDTTARAPVLIGADGLRSGVRRALGLDAPAPAHPRFGIGCHLRHLPRRDPTPRVEVFVGPDHELYTTPTAPDETCVAALVSQDTLKAARPDLEATLRQWLAASGGPNAELARAPLSGPVRAIGPLGLGARVAHAERALLIGDAAGALDPITGEGLSIGLVTTRLAAEVLEHAFTHDDFSAKRLAAFSRARRAEVRPLALFTSAVLRLAHHPDLARYVIRNLARGPETFQRLLGVAAGVAPLRSLRARDGVRVLLGL